jgi:hypothetical protein
MNKGQRKTCCSACPEKEAPQIINAYVHGKPTEFLCCGKKECAFKQLEAASQAHCCGTECSKPVNLDYTLPVFARSDLCTSGAKGCGQDCQDHIIRGANWLFCGDVCKNRFRSILYGPKDAHLGPITRIQVCSGCDKQHVNNTKLQRCSRCKLAVYCGKECQLKHWRSGHKSICKK